MPLGYASINKKLVVVPQEAETVRLIFRRYLELGSLGALIPDLDRRGIRTRRQEISDGRIRGGIRFGVGPLAHLLRNRFYIGEVVYRGKVHRGEHEAIVDPPLFEAVQAKLAAGAAARRLRLKGTPAVLTRRLFDDRGNRMTPTHANKQGVRYRYYVSHPILQKRRAEAGSIARVAAPDLEAIVLQALRDRYRQPSNGGCPTITDDRDLIANNITRVVVRPHVVEIHLLAEPGDLASGSRAGESRPPIAGDHSPAVISVAWSANSIEALKGILHLPSPDRTLTPEKRDALLTAIAKARRWIDDLSQGRAASFGEIAEREGKVERHIRSLAPLACMSPRIVSALIEGSAPADLTVTELAKSLPCSWSEQEQRFGLQESGGVR